MSRAARAARDSELLHERARMLASGAIDMELEPADSAWLAQHLEGCDDCRTIAADYATLRNELRSLAVPEPPRDLWARTSAALDEIDRSSPRRETATRPGFGGWSANRSFIGTAMAVSLVVIISGISLLSQVPGSHGSESARPSQIALSQPSPPSAEAPVAVVDGTGYWIVRDGETYQIRLGSAKCSGTIDRCSVSNESGTTMGSITSTSPVFAALAPDAKQAAVWNGDTIAIVPLAPEAPSTVAIDQMTPRPSTTASAVASLAQPTPTVTSTSTVGPSASSTPASSETAIASASPTTSASPSQIATSSPTAVSSPAPVRVPTAILNGYKVSGRDPEFSADGQWVAFSAVPTDNSAGPDLFVWQVGQERAHAVTSSHADLFSGWFGTRILVSELTAGPVIPAADASASNSPTPTTGDSSSPSALTPSGTPSPTAAPVTGPSATSYLFDPATQNVQRIDRPMLLPVADPTRTFLVYWSGTIEMDPVSGQFKVGKGNLYLDSWANVKLEPASLAGVVPTPSATPSTASQEPSASPTPVPTASIEATPSPSASPSPSPSASDAGSLASITPQLSAPPVSPALLRVAVVDNVENWVIEWDVTGQHVAVWVADPSSQSVGVVSLFAIDRGSGLVATDMPLFAARGLSSVQFDHGFLVYTTPAEGSDGKTYLVPVPPTPPMPSASPSPSPSATEVPSGPPTSTPVPTAPPVDGPGS